MRFVLLGRVYCLDYLVIHFLILGPSFVLLNPPFSCKDNAREMDMQQQSIPAGETGGPYQTWRN